MTAREYIDREICKRDPASVFDFDDIEKTTRGRGIDRRFYIHNSGHARNDRECFVFLVVVWGGWELPTT